MIILKNVTLRRSSKVLLDKTSVTINPGEKVGLVGRNGAGKSTLFALLNGTLHEDGGDYSIPRQWQMGQVLQDTPQRCIWEVVLGKSTTSQSSAIVTCSATSPRGCGSAWVT